MAEQVPRHYHAIVVDHVRSSIIGSDEEIDRGGFETGTYWIMMHRVGFRLAAAKGSAQNVADNCINLISRLAS